MVRISGVDTYCGCQALPQEPGETGTVISHVVQVRKPGHREVKELGQGVELGFRPRCLAPDTQHFFSFAPKLFCTGRAVFQLPGSE